MIDVARASLSHPDDLALAMSSRRIDKALGMIPGQEFAVLSKCSRWRRPGAAGFTLVSMDSRTRSDAAYGPRPSRRFRVSFGFPSVSPAPTPDTILASDR